MTRENFKTFFGDFAGAFADGGILFPLLVMLSFQGAFSAPKLFASAGLAYLISGFIFRLPLSVQPLKAIAIAALAVGASGFEIRLSAFCLGAICLALTFINVNQLAKKIPASVIHSVQLGLGVILLTQGFSAVAGETLTSQCTMLALLIALCAFPSFSLLGLLALGGIVAGLFFPSLLPAVTVKTQALKTDVRFFIILSLVLPQIALTLTNSVVATADVAKKYYGSLSGRVTEKNLLLSIGIGNIITSLWGGLPFCHGAGGMTAHYRGGARTWHSNLIIGTFLLGVAVYSFVSAKPVVIGYPVVILASLLMAVGIFHIGLAKSTWSTTPGKVQLAFSALAAFRTHNMLIVLGVALVTQFVIGWALARTPSTARELSLE